MSRQLDRRDFLRTSAAAASTLAVSGLSTAQAAASSRPNIVMVYADDLDFDEIGAYDHVEYPSWTGARERGLLGENFWGGYRDPRMLTPNIDSLGSEGATFSRFYITTSICTPSRYSALTGRFASRSPGFCAKHPPGGPANIQWNTPVDTRETNIARELRKQGYATGVVGKWHSGAPNAIARGIPADAEYDAKVYGKLHTAHERGCEHLRDGLGFGFADRIYFSNKEALGLPKWMQVHNLDWITEGALNFIDRYHRQPFCLYMPLTTPHGSYGAKWIDEDPRITPAGMLKKAPDGMPSRQSIRERLDAEGIDRRNAPATWIDDSVGAVMKRLDDLGVADNTVVIFTSDHQSRGKYTCYESSRVPCLIRWPRAIAPGTEIDSICANIDLAATFIEMAGGSAPDDMTMDGRSFLPWLTGNATEADRRDALLLECSNIRAVVTEQHKFIVNRPGQEALDRMAAEATDCARTGERRQIGWDGSRNPHPNEKGIRYGSDRDFPRYFDIDQLYDLESDIYEQDNVIADHPAVADRLRARLTDLLAPLPHTFGEFKTS